MDRRTKQAMNDMRHDLAKLELQLSEIKRGDYYKLPDGTKFDKRSVIEDQILELRMRLKDVMGWEKEDEMQSCNTKTD